MTLPGEPSTDVDGASPLSAADLLLSVVDGTLSRVARRPLRVRARSTPWSALRGEVDALVLELGDLSIAGLSVDRLLVHVERFRMTPGVPPRLKAGPLGFKATVTQDAIDDWVRSVHLPVRLTLTPSGVHARTSLAGVSLSEVDCELEVRGPFLGLRPQRASMLGVPAPIVGMFRGYLPLPPLPMGARLQRVDPDHGRLTAWFSLDDVDEPLTPRVARVLQRRLLPGLR